jgi:hypothetical protein
MPIICVGAVLLVLPSPPPKLGIFGRVLLAVLVLVYFFGLWSLLLW